MRTRKLSGEQLALAVECDHQTLSKTNSGFEDLAAATGTVFGRLINAPQTQQALKVKSAVKAAQAKAKKVSMPVASTPESFEGRLKELDGLKEKGLISEEEYQRKRERLIGEM